MSEAGAAGALRSVYRRLLRRYGPQLWWPAETAFEVMVGAVLTQNTAWINVERAIANLRAADCLEADRILALRQATLAAMLRPAGYFNVKARRLRNYCRWYRAQGGHAAITALDTVHLRRELLSVNGIGPETADDILLYALGRPVFVIDAYTRRLFGRLGLVDDSEGYEVLRGFFERHLQADAALFNEYHALIVRHAKDICKTRPRCAACCLHRQCPARQPVSRVQPP